MSNRKDESFATATASEATGKKRKAFRLFILVFGHALLEQRGSFEICSRKIAVMEAVGAAAPRNSLNMAHSRNIGLQLVGKGLPLAAEEEAFLSPLFS